MGEPYMKARPDAVQRIYLHSRAILYLVRGGANRPRRFPNLYYQPIMARLVAVELEEQVGDRRHPLLEGPMAARDS